VSAPTPPSRCEDHQDVLDTVVRYSTALDARDWGLLDRVFLQDAIAHYKVGTLHGRDAIVAMIRDHLGGCGPSQHLLGNHRIALDGDVATSVCSARVMHIGAGPRADLTPFEVFGTYSDRLVRTEDGWRIQERHVDWTITRGDRDILQPG
jgi:hypothetical protein